MASSRAVSVAVADAVFQELRTTTRTLNPTYGRTYNTDRKLKDNGVLHIDVIGAGYKLTPMSRDTIARDPIVQIVVRKRLDNVDKDDDKAELDRLCLLAEEIENTFAQAWLDGASVGAAWQSCETFGPLDDDYHEWRQFTVVIAITFRSHGD
jgi:hypothetical protein